MVLDFGAPHHELFHVKEVRIWQRTVVSDRYDNYIQQNFICK